MARGDLAEGPDPSELLRSMSLLPVSLALQVVLIVLIDSTAVAEAIVVYDHHRIAIAVGLQAVDGLVLAVAHRALGVLLVLTVVLDEVVVTEVGVGVLSCMKPIDLVLSILDHVGVDRAKDLEAVVLGDFEFDLHALAVIAEVMAVTILLPVAVVNRQAALVVCAVRGLRHCWRSLGCLSQSLLLVLVELADQGLEVVCGDYLLGVLIAEKSFLAP